MDWNQFLPQTIFSSSRTEILLCLVFQCYQRCVHIITPGTETVFLHFCRSYFSGWECARRQKFASTGPHPQHVQFGHAWGQVFPLLRHKLWCCEASCFFNTQGGNPTPFSVLCFLSCTLPPSVLTSSPFPEPPPLCRWHPTVFLILPDKLSLKHYSPTKFPSANLFLDDCQSPNSQFLQDCLFTHWTQKAAWLLT